MHFLIDFLLNIINRLLFGCNILVGRQPIVVYQRGKVGSSTILATLKKNLRGVNVVQCHFLEERNLLKVCSQYRDKGLRLRWHLHNSKTLRNFLKRQTDTLYISAVRNPLDAAISAFFENYYLYLSKDELLDKSVLLPALKKNLIDDRYIFWFDHWFESEFGSFLGCDITTIKQTTDRLIRVNCDFGRIVILRNECLNDGLEELFSSSGILDKNKITGLEIVQANISEAKFYSEQYRWAKSKLAEDADLNKLLNESWVYSTFYKK